MLQSFQPVEDLLLEEEDPGIDIWFPQGSGKTHFHPISLWSIMSDRPSYTVHPQPSGVIGTGCMDSCIDKLNCQTPLEAMENPLIFEGIESLDYISATLHYC